MSWLKAALFGHRVYKWWRRNEVGKRILGTRSEDEKEEADMNIRPYKKAIVAVVGALLAMGSRFVPALEDADAQMLVEGVILAGTAVGVFGAQNED